MLPFFVAESVPGDVPGEVADSPVLLSIGGIVIITRCTQ